MGRGIQYTVKSYVMIDGEPQEFCKLDDQTREKYKQKMLDNMGEVLSDYYSDHPDEFEKLSHKPYVEVVR